ncbi:glycosyltransferase family 2 protein [Pseudothermotoga sp. U03pept]|uniref:glycosyltransferase family 2 protein n=1 Tax=Pseudothermotoga sp. U03pept TaxID=3447012 RepID=UPI003F07ABE8
MRLAVGIPTLNRPEDLKRTIMSILKNSVLPDAIFVADQSDDDTTMRVCEQLEKEAQGVKLVYLRMDRKGLTRARNKILDETIPKYDIIAFLDDDVVLDKEYISEIRKTFLHDDDVTGVTGRMIQKVRKFGLKLDYNIYLFLSYLRAFLRGYFSVAAGIFLPPRVNEYLVNTFPVVNPLRRNLIENAQWLYGGLMSYRTRDLRYKRFDEQLILYGFAEDLIFSYSLWLEGKKLVVNPRALVQHVESPASRLNQDARTLMMIGYRLYALAKFRPKSVVEKLSTKLVNFYLPIMKLSKEQKEEILRVIEKHKDEIFSGNLENLNAEIIRRLTRGTRIDQLY